MKQLHSGARTRACSAGTFAGGRARPAVLRRCLHEACSYRIVFYIPHNPLELDFVPNPMIVGFPLPERSPGMAKTQVRLSCRRSLERAKQLAWIDLRKQQHVDVIGHDHPCSKIVVPQFDPAYQGIGHLSGDGFQSQVHRSNPRRIQIPVHPDEGTARVQCSLRRIARLRKTSMEMPGDKQPLVFGVVVREAPAGGHMREVVRRGYYSLKPRRQECRRRTHECVRHIRGGQVG